ncbi:MAG: hypothetical protein ABH863_01710 [Candidatus Micrarchaeota archaeon]
MGRTLTEFYCTANGMEKASYSCNEGCFFGACKEEPQDIISQIVRFVSNLFGKPDLSKQPGANE